MQHKKQFLYIFFLLTGLPIVFAADMAPGPSRKMGCREFNTLRYDKVPIQSAELTIHIDQDNSEETMMNSETLRSGMNLKWDVSSGFIKAREIALKNLHAPSDSFSEVTDIEGNIYKTVKIGNQVWMAENLNVKKFNDGTPIPYVGHNDAWSGISTYGFCWYGNDSLFYSAPYGALYNWYVIDNVSNGNKNVCPQGWHVPTDEDWIKLTDHWGGLAGMRLNETGTSQSNTPDIKASDVIKPLTSPISGRNFFSTGGFRYASGNFYYAGYTGYWWSAAGHPVYYYWDTDLRSYSNVARYAHCSKKMGFAVRCVKD